MRPQHTRYEITLFDQCAHTYSYRSNELVPTGDPGPVKFWGPFVIVAFLQGFRGRARVGRPPTPICPVS